MVQINYMGKLGWGGRWSIQREATNPIELNMTRCAADRYNSRMPEGNKPETETIKLTLIVVSRAHAIHTLCFSCRTVQEIQIL